jgi:hypothetical protein
MADVAAGVLPDAAVLPAADATLGPAVGDCVVAIEEPDVPAMLSSVWLMDMS